jgi:hypothetical protein
VAQALRARAIPFAFVSGSHRLELPPELVGTPFIAKPYAEAAIRGALPA